MSQMPLFLALTKIARPPEDEVCSDETFKGFNKTGAWHNYTHSIFQRIGENLSFSSRPSGPALAWQLLHANTLICQGRVF